MSDPSSGRDDSEVIFNNHNRDEASSQFHVYTSSPLNQDEMDVGLVSDESEPYRETAVNTSFQGHPTKATGQTVVAEELLNNITGALKDVVQELKSLSHEKQVRNDGHERDIERNIGRSRHGFNSDGAGNDANFNSNIPQGRSEQGRFSAPGGTGDHYDTAPYQFQDHYRSRQMGHVKIQPFTGKEDWQVWISRFETLALRYRWTEDEKLDQLLPRIEGLAGQFVFTQLPAGIVTSYRDLIREMNNRFRKIETSRSFAAKLSRRNQRAGETAEDYAADLKLLYDKAHGYRDRTTRDEDLVRRFLDGLRDEEARFEVEFHKEPTTIDEAVFHVVNFIQTKSRNDYDRRASRGARRTINDEEGGVKDDEGLNNEQMVSYTRIAKGSWGQEKQRENMASEKKDSKALGQSDVCKDKNTNDLLQAILKRLEKLEASPVKDTNRNQRRSDVTCYNCQHIGHFARECPDKPKVYNGNRRQVDPLRNNNKQPLNYQGPSLVARERSSQRRN